jgi:hypothetical protein
MNMKYKSMYLRSRCTTGVHTAGKLQLVALVGRWIFFSAAAVELLHNCALLTADPRTVFDY